MAVLGEKEWRDHALLIGAVTLGWNRAVHQLLRAFTHLTGVESPLADVIFFGSQSDSAQRRMLVRVAKTVELTDDGRDRLIALIRRLDTASISRNLATHTIFGVTAYHKATDRWGPKIVPMLDPMEGSRLKEDFEAQFRDVENELGVIIRELEDWLVQTPYPPRAWTGPPLPLAAAADVVRALAQAEFDAELSYGSRAEDDDAG